MRSSPICTHQKLRQEDSSLFKSFSHHIQCRDQVFIDDLGKDVPPEVIVDTAVEQDIRLVGLSALMTTTVVSMEETIKLLRERKPECKVMVGGAVLNQDYADMIGADFYGKDAMQSVYYAQRVFGEE